MEVLDTRVANPELISGTSKVSDEKCELECNASNFTSLLANDAGHSLVRTARADCIVPIIELEVICEVNSTAIVTRLYCKVVVGWSFTAPLGEEFIIDIHH